MSEFPLELRPGDRITIPSGIFIGMEAEVTEVDPASHSVTLMFSVFGQPVIQQFTFGQWTKSSERSQRGGRSPNSRLVAGDARKRPIWFPTLEENDGPLTVSKYAGRPWLAEGEAWRHVALQATAGTFLKLNLSDLPTEVAGKFGTGLLQFFYCPYERDVEQPSWKPSLHFSTSHWLRIVRPDGTASSSSTPDAARASSLRRSSFDGNRLTTIPPAWSMKNSA